MGGEMEFAVEPVSKLQCQNDTLVSVNHLRQLSLSVTSVSPKPVFWGVYLYIL
jgi:hypothetical protein